jgi:hypothetical protein
MKLSNFVLSRFMLSNLSVGPSARKKKDTQRTEKKEFQKVKKAKQKVEVGRVRARAFYYIRPKAQLFSLM